MQRSVNQHFEYNIQLRNTVKVITKVTTKDIYWHLMNKKPCEATACSKWELMYPNFVFNWDKIFALSYSFCTETKLQSFQFRILHRYMLCNKRLYDMKLRESPLCEICDEVEDIPHRLFYCQECKVFWNQFGAWWENHQLEC